jgi:hypothetical protein
MSILILSSHLNLGFLSGLSPSGLPTKILYTYLIATMHATCHAHISLNNIWCNVQVMKLLIMQYSPANYPFLPFRSKYFPQSLVTEHPHLCSSLYVRDQVSRPYTTVGKIMVLNIFKL